MISLSTSTIAALEEMLQNSARSAPADFMPIYLSCRIAQEQPIGYLNPEHYPHESLQKQAIPLVKIGNDRLTIQSGKPRELSSTLYQLAKRMQMGGFIPGWRNEDFS